ncbi:MAG: ABC transporter permease [Patescibacteria group bacterium]
MNFAETLKISMRAIKVNKARSALTMLGIIIGVASVILLVSIVSGLGKTIREELNSFGANLLVVFPGSPEGGRGPGGVVANKMEFRFEKLILEKVPEIENVVATIQSVGTLRYKNKDIADSTIYGVSGTYFKALNISVIEGRPFTKSESANVVVIGKTVRDKLFANSNPLGKELIIKDRRFKVIGVQKERGSIFGRDQDNVALLPLAPSRSLLGLDRPNWFFIKVVPERDIKLAKEAVKKVLLTEMKEDDFTVSTQEDTLQLVGRILGVLSLGLGGIAAISMLVGGVGIMNIMLVSVTERTREIGLRKALGARRRDILLQFLVEAIVLSLLGGFAGVVIGIGSSFLLDRFIATEVNYVFVVLSFGVSAIIGIVFGIAPAIRASKLSPIEALRYE